MAATSTVSAPPVQQRRSGYRPELQGVRALAAMLVVVYHVWLDRVSGGVDVFFLISGFLITGQLFRASERGGVAFRALWGRMIKRLFPATLTVLVVTMAAAVVILPEERWFQTIREVVAAALYLENWQLAADSVDYFARQNTASVVQHFWSLSIQGQFYLVWPLLVAAVAVLARGLRARLWPVLLGAMVALLLASLAYSVYLTKANQPLAYFHALTRVWEFALGGVLGLCVTLLVLPRVVRIVLGWVGVVGLVSCGMVLTVGSQFPGYFALWPTLSAALCIVAGATGSRVGADRLLASRGMEYLGNLSFSLYLWHWPVLLFALLLTNRGEMGLVGGAAVIGLSLVLAVLTYHLVEEPVRRSRIGEHTNWGAHRFGALILAVVLAMAGGWQFYGTQRADFSVAVDDPDHPGAQSRVPGFRYQGAADAELIPPQVALREDWARVGNCRYSPRHPELQICASRPKGPPERRIVVVGDSHAQQYLGALLPIAQRRNWQIVSMLKGACPFSTNADAAPGDQSCVDWNSAVLDEINATRPDAVFTLASRDVRTGLTESTPDGFVRQWSRVDPGIAVLAVRDFPRYDRSPSSCAITYGVDAARCATPRGELLADPAPYERMPAVPRNVSFMDFSDYFCTESVCPPTIGNVLVYMDNNHPGATYMATLAPIMYERITSLLEW